AARREAAPGGSRDRAHGRCLGPAAPRHLADRRYSSRPGRTRGRLLSMAALGTTDLKISRVGFGAWALGGSNYDWGWGAQDDGQSIAAIHHALDLGVNWIDTAAQYGFGHSEEIVGRALQAYSGERPFLFTKGGQPEGP